MPRDLPKAYMWLSLATSNGSREGRINRDILAQNMAPEEVREGQQMAIQWLDNARASGDPDNEDKKPK